ncbi:hypothetical protein [Gemmatimonas sp.]|uniref:hypothetical protein n=1 Tax=Gemmatimonas sp. TaxID=1962908 RepID=UPI0035612A44
MEIDPISKHGDGAQSRLVMRPLGRTINLPHTTSTLCATSALVLGDGRWSCATRTMSVVIRRVAFTNGTRQQWMTA